MKELKLPKAFVVYGATLLLVVALVVVSISGGIFRGASDEQGPRLIQVDPEEYKYQDSAVSVLNAISIQSNYIDAVKEFNQTIIQLNYLTSK